MKDQISGIVGFSFRPIGKVALDLVSDGLLVAAGAVS